MRRNKLALGLWASLIVAGLDGPAGAQDHEGHVGPFEGPSGFYRHPNGRKEIEERVAKPQNAEANQDIRSYLQGFQGFEAADTPQLELVPRSTTKFEAATNVLAADGGDKKVEVVYSFGLKYKNIPLSEETSQSVILQEAGAIRRPVLVSGRNLPNANELAELNAGQYAAGTGSLDTAELEDIGVARSREDYQKAKQRANPMIYRDDPPRLEIRKIKGRPARLVWTYVVVSDNLYLPLYRRFYVPISGPRENVEFKDYAYSFDDNITGFVKGTYLAKRKSNLSSGASTESGPLANLKVVRGTEVKYTDPQGKFTFTGPGSSEISVLLEGPYCRIVDQAGNPIQASKSGNSFNYNATGELQLAQVTAFRWVNEVALFTRGLLTSPNLPDDFRPRLLDGLLTRVNISKTCNANWDGRAINFFKSGRCLDQFGQPTDTVGSNSAYSDIIFHEYGHGVDDALGFILDSGYSEGFGDAVAILMTRDHVLGADWKKLGNGSVRPARDAANNVQWPDVEDAEEHQQGMAYNGFVWSLIEALEADNPGDSRFVVAQDLVFGAALRNPTSIPDAVLKSFLFDFQNGGNNYEALKKAARAHGIPYPKTRNVLANPGDLADNLLSKGDPGF